MNHARLFFVLVIAGLSSACVGSDDGDPVAEPSTTIERATTTTSEPQTSADSTPEVSPSATPVRIQLDWAVDALNDGGLPADEIEERFSPAFLAQIPVDQVVASTLGLFVLAEPPYTVESFEAGDDGLSAEAVLLGADGRRLAAQIVVAAGAPNFIEGLGFVSTELEFPRPISVEAIDGRLAELGPRSSLGVYDVTDGGCEAIHEIRPDITIVLGSVFKLWVLAALAHEVEEGRADWDEMMAVTDELRSTPDGEIYELETGAEVTLERLAEAMISVSDNTATDMLIDRLGRQAVEGSLDRVGVSDPAANIPMLSTGNLFALKFVAEAPNAADYRLLDEDDRRLLLAELDGAVLPWVASGMTLAELAESTNADGVAIGDPRDLDVEWFATTEDLCRTLVHLHELAGTPGLEPVAAILEINPGAGIPFDRERWSTVRFKGGSEPGVLAGAWWFEGPDGDRHVVAGGVANPDAAINELDAVLTVASAIELID